MVMGRLEEQIGGEGVTQRFGIAPDLLLYLNSGRGQLSLEQEPHNPPPIFLLLLLLGPLSVSL